MESAPSRSFYDIPWRWRDLCVGLIPVIAAFSATSLLPPSQWLWIPATMFLMAWMVAYPIWAAGGLAIRPGVRHLLVEGSIALLSVPLAFIMLTGLSFALVRIFANAPSLPVGPSSSDGVQSFVLIAVAVAIAPIAEEIFFRGMLYNALRRRIHPLPAALLQALVFGLLHPFNLPGKAMVAATGLCFAGIYQWRKTLLTPVFLHAIMNAVSMAVLMYQSAATPVLGVQVTPHESGCRVTEIIPGGSAEASDLRPGDVIRSVDGVRVSDRPSLVFVLRTKHVGDKARIDYIRGGEDHRTEITLKGRPR